MNSSNLGRFAKVAIGLAALYVVGYVGFWQWSVCRIEVEPGYSLKLRYRGRSPSPWARWTRPTGRS